jgi:hypothetical protein
MNNEKVMRLALEALKTLVDRFDYEQFTSVCELDDAKDAIKALEEALAKQEQGEPVATDWERIARVQNAKLMAMCGEAGGFEKLCEVMDKYESTTPQQRTWVGLDEEDDIDWEEGGSLRDLVEAVEAKLKEKNT